MKLLTLTALVILAYAIIECFGASPQLSKQHSAHRRSLDNDDMVEPFGQQRNVVNSGIDYVDDSCLIFCPFGSPYEVKVYLTPEYNYQYDCKCTERSLVDPRAPNCTGISAAACPLFCLEFPTTPMPVKSCKASSGSAYTCSCVD